MSDDQEIVVIHFPRKVLEDIATAAAKGDELKAEILGCLLNKDAQGRLCFEDCFNPSCPVSRDGQDAYLHTQAQLLECLNKMKDEDGKEAEIMPGVFVSKAPDLSVVDQDSEVQIAERLKGIPSVPKKGEKISRRENAESVARCLRGDLRKREPVSEAEVQEALKWIDDREQERAHDRAVLLATSLGLVAIVVVVSYIIFAI